MQLFILYRPTRGESTLLPTDAVNTVNILEQFVGKTVPGISAYKQVGAGLLSPAPPQLDSAGHDTIT